MFIPFGFRVCSLLIQFGIQRESLLLPKKQKLIRDQQPPMITDYHPLLPPIKKIFRNYEYILHRDERLKQIFPKPPMVGYRRCGTLRNALVKARLRKENQTGTEKGFNHCGRKGCTTCLHSIPSNTFQSSFTNRTYSIWKKITCDSSNIIYLITCLQCNKQYVGESGRKLK